MHFLWLQAPEVFIGNYGLEADIWAAGMMMYQLLVRRSSAVDPDSFAGSCCTLLSPTAAAWTGLLVARQLYSGFVVWTQPADRIVKRKRLRLTRAWAANPQADRFPWWSTMEELHTTTLEAVRALLLGQRLAGH